MKTEANSKDIMLKYGIYLGLASIALGVIMYVSGGTYSGNTLIQTLFSLAGLAAIILFIVLAIKQLKNQNGGFLQLSEALKVGVAVALIGAIIGGIYTYVFTTIIEPDFYAKMSEITMKKMEADFPHLSKEEIQNAMEISNKMSSPFLVFTLSLIGNLLFGLIVSLIAGAVMQKKEQTF